MTSLTNMSCNAVPSFKNAPAAVKPRAFFQASAFVPSKQYTLLPKTRTAFVLSNFNSLPKIASISSRTFLRILACVDPPIIKESPLFSNFAMCIKKSSIRIKVLPALFAPLAANIFGFS